MQRGFVLVPRPLTFEHSYKLILAGKRQKILIFLQKSHCLDINIINIVLDVIQHFYFPLRSLSRTFRRHI